MSSTAHATLAATLVAVYALHSNAAPADWLPVRCDAFRTVGLHDLPGGAENYQSVVFFESTFTLRENTMFMSHLLGTDTDTTLYVTLENDDGATEFECRPVRGASNAEGFSCINNPPSEMLLVNPASGRFTRSSIGGWTFFGAHEQSNGASLFVEYGDCGRQSGAADP